MFSFILNIFSQAWGLLLDASVYMIFGIVMGGLLKVFLNPGSVARHLGESRFASVFKAALLGVPVPLCSCGVLPAAASLKRQGANNGALTAFLISTPESGVDSIAITYALMDPVMTAARPLSAFATAVTAGVVENVLASPDHDRRLAPDLSCPVDNCCPGIECPPEIHSRHHTLPDKLRAGMKFAFGEVWSDLAPWFLVGLLLAGLITTLLPPDLIGRRLGGGLPAMLVMLAVGIPLYICATASTPIAAALVLKGLSPGAALVFLLVGPATNITSLTMLIRILGKRATAVYLISLSVCAVAFGLVLDLVYQGLGLSAKVLAGQAGEWIPGWIELSAGMFLLAISIRPVWRKLVPSRGHADHSDHSDACCTGRHSPEIGGRETAHSTCTTKSSGGCSQGSI